MLIMFRSNKHECCYSFFFFKQNKAYDLRISDWSSDVCSSDLDRSSRPRSIGMIAVIFEAQPHPERGEAYLDAAQQLRPLLADIDGFISIERFGSLTAPGKMLSLSFWRDEQAVRQWRNLEERRPAG